MRRCVRYLRIAFSVISGIACVLLICLWAYSNVSVDNFTLPVSETTNFSFTSFPNEIAIGFYDRRLEEHTWHHQTPTDEWLQHYWSYYATPWSATPYFTIREGIVCLPYWFVVLFAALSSVVALLFGTAWRFSLRTLLIAMAVLAVALAEIMYILRH